VRPFIVVGLVCLVQAQRVRADQTLFGFTMDVAGAGMVGGGTGGNGYSPFAYVYFGYGLYSPRVLFGDVPRSEEDVGKVFTASAGSPGFADFAAKITDGQSESLAFGFLSVGGPGGGAATVWPEPLFIYHPAGSGTAVDLQGDTINSVTMRINAYSAVVTQTTGAYDVNATVTVYGTGPAIGTVTDFTPEPSQVTSLCVAASLRRHRRTPS
jgi:hypothetical protein